MRVTWLSLLLASAALGCGGSTTRDSPSSGGVGGAVVSGGSGGGSGVGGSGALGGSGGAGGSGGSSGTGGGVGGGCSSAADCKLFSDCCSCSAYGPNESPPDPCLAECSQSLCSELGIDQQSVTCVAGRCTAGINCDWTSVFCNGLPQECAPGDVPSVDNGCWGPCVPATQCAGVNDCGECNGQLMTCVTIELQGGGPAPPHHCIDLPESCATKPVCACMSNVCQPPYSACTDVSGTLVCSCPDC